MRLERVARDAPWFEFIRTSEYEKFQLEKLVKIRLNIKVCCFIARVVLQPFVSDI